MRRWLLKTEPSEYSFERLLRERRTTWNGVTNALALKHLREMRAGDPVLVYHTGTVRSCVGLARVVRDAYPDPSADDPKLAVVDLEADRPLPKPVALEVIKRDPAFRAFDLVRLSRLSVMPVPPDAWARLLSLAGEA